MLTCTCNMKARLRFVATWCFSPRILLYITFIDMKWYTELPNYQSMRPLRKEQNIRRIYFEFPRGYLFLNNYILCNEYICLRQNVMILNPIDNLDQTVVDLVVYSTCFRHHHSMAPWGFPLWMNPDMADVWLPGLIVHVQDTSNRSPGPAQGRVSEANSLYAIDLMHWSTCIWYHGDVLMPPMDRQNKIE